MLRTLPGGLGGQPRLADATGSGQCQQPRVARRQPVDDFGHVVVTADQPGALRRHRCAGIRTARCDRVEGAVVAQDGQLESPELGPGIDTQFLGQQGTSALCGVQRSAGLTAAVQREHQLADQPLPGRVGVGHRGELTEDLLMAAQPENPVEPVLHGGQPGLLKATAQALADLRGRGVGQRRSRPQQQCLVQPGHPGLIVGRRPGLGDAVDEPVHVDLPRIGSQRVAHAVGGDRHVRVAGQYRAEIGHQHVHRVCGAARRIRRPQPFDQPLQRHHPVHVPCQHGEDETLLARPEVHHRVPDPSPHRSQQQQLHAHPHVSTGH